MGRRNAERLRQLVAKREIVGAAARAVNAIDPDSVEASCLAHDLGHPPFGHIAEQVLQQEASPFIPEGFEGNAQSFRIVTRLAVRIDTPGLDLTRGTLDGLLKYPWRYWPKDQSPGAKRERKWGYFQDDADAFAFARAGCPPEKANELPERSLAAEIMDWADDLTYAVHDVDDFFRAGLVPLDRLAEKNGNERSHLRQMLEEIKRADPTGFPDATPAELVATAGRVLSLNGPDAPYEHTVSARVRMRSFGTKLITRYLEAFTLADDPTGKIKLEIDPDAYLEVVALKMLVVAYVIHRPGMAVVQHGQKRVIKELFEAYFMVSAKAGDPGSDHRLLPPGARERLANSAQEESDRARVVVDLLAGLSEEAAIQLHRRFSGGWTAPTLDATAAFG